MAPDEPPAEVRWVSMKSETAELLRAPEVARRLGLSTREVVRLIYDRRIRFVMVDGVAHVPVEALEDYRHQAR